jgi:hypothetical protein
VIVIEATLPDAESDHIDRDARAQDARDERDAHPDTGPAPCDTADAPKDNPCVITDALGVFVAPEASGGNDTTGTGTRSQPYATLGMGIASAVTAGKRVYACGATYPESLVVSVAMDGVQVYGGLECPTAGDGGVADAGTIDGSTGAWSYNGTPAAVAPTATGYALDIESLTKGAHFEDLSFTALDANAANAGESSIGVMVNASQKVSFVRVSATAGSGSMGALGSALATNMCATSLSGSAATGGGGGNSGACTCPVFGVTAGGGGGSGGLTAGTMAGTGSAIPATTLTLAGYDGVGGTGATVAPLAKCQNGDDGANGSPQSGGTKGGAGSLTSSGWQPVTAGSGMPGDPGEGGGGGGGDDGTGALGGAGGGGGGCGGNGGAGGGGGGASIAIAVVNSTVTLTSITLTTAIGGQGGTGAQGEQGQAGGAGGAMSGQCSGGIGGQGAGGSGGGGGAGGPSVGVGLSGTSTLDIDGKSTTTAATLKASSSFVSGSAGGAGSGGLAGLAATDDVGNPGQAGNAGNPGPAGIAGAVEAL